MQLSAKLLKTSPKHPIYFLPPIDLLIVIRISTNQHILITHLSPAGSCCYVWKSSPTCTDGLCHVMCHVCTELSSFMTMGHVWMAQVCSGQPRFSLGWATFDSSCVLVHRCVCRTPVHPWPKDTQELEFQHQCPELPSHPLSQADMLKLVCIHHFIFAGVKNTC